MEESAITVIMPAYNEEDCIHKAVEEVQKQILDSISDSRLIVIDDGSGDATGEILDRMARQDSRINVIHQDNSGHGPSLYKGLNEADSKFVFLIDSDRQIPLDAFPPLWEAVQECDGVFGVRAQRDDPPIRIYLSKFVRTVVGLIFGVRLRDVNVPFKLFRLSIWHKAREWIPADTLAPSIFLAVYMCHRNYNLMEKEVPHCERSTGVVSNRRWKLFSFCARAFGQLMLFPF